MKILFAPAWTIGMATACVLAIAHEASPAMVNFSKNAFHPSPAQAKAIRRAAGSDIKEFNHPER